MKKVRFLVPFALFVLACDSTPPEPPNTPPEAVGTIADREMHAGERFVVSDLGQYFTDADGDELTYDAEAAGESVVSVDISGSAMLLYSTGGRGTAAVTVVAMDPDSASAEQTFDITVVNRAPVGSTIPSLRLATDTHDSLDASWYFRDPDGDDLSYTVVSEDTGVVAVDVDADIVSLSTGSQEASVGVTITAMDQYGDSAVVSFVVEIYVRGTGFRDDFDSSSSLEDWDVRWLRARVVDSMVVLDNGKWGDTVPAPPHIGRDVKLSEGWTLSFSFELNNNADPILAAVVFTGHPRFPVWIADYDWWEDAWSVTVFDVDSDLWVSVDWGDLSLANHEQSVWEWRLSDKNIMTLVVDGQEVYRDNLSGMFGGPPLDAIGVGLGFYGWSDEDDGVTYDFVEIK